METVLGVMIAGLVGGIILGFYMDWFGLWVTEAEMKDQREMAKKRVLEQECRSRNQTSQSASVDLRDTEPAGRLESGLRK